MIELNLAHYRKARVWLSDLPDVRIRRDQLIKRSVQTKLATFNETRRAAIEVLIPRGPRALYGLLGAELRPESSDSLIISVATSGDCQKPFQDSIALSADKAYVGFPFEFSEAVFEGVSEEIKKTGKFSSGELKFEFAAHSSAGSAPIVFRWLAGSLVRILAEGDKISEQQLIEILQEVF